VTGLTRQAWRCPHGLECRPRYCGAGWEVTEPTYARPVPPMPVRSWPIMASFGESAPEEPSWPDPEQSARPARDEELPRTCLKLVTAARAAGHDVAVTLARGTASVTGMVLDPSGELTPTGRPKRIKSSAPKVVESIVVRVELLAPADPLDPESTAGRVGSIRAVWEEGSFLAAWASSNGSDPVTRVGAAGLVKLVRS
jgi:hypothetical protein